MSNWHSPLCLQNSHCSIVANDVVASSGVGSEHQVNGKDPHRIAGEWMGISPNMAAVGFPPACWGSSDPGKWRKVETAWHILTPELREIRKKGNLQKKRGKPDNVVGNRKGGNQEISGNQNQHESTACPNIAVLATNWPASARAKELVSSTGESAEWAALDLE